MSKLAAPKSVLSNDSNENLDIISDLTNPKIDEKTFVNLLTAFDQKFLAEPSSIQIPKESKKRLQKTVENLLKSLYTTSQPSLYLTLENSSILSVFLHTLHSDTLKSTKKKNNLIVSIQKLFQALNESLITDIIEFHIFQKFSIFLIKILEVLNERSEDKSKELICGAIMTLLKGASDTFHKYFFDLFIDEDDVVRPRMSVYLNVGCEKNLLNLALACLNKTFPHPDCKNEQNVILLFEYLSTLVERHESAEATYVVVCRNLGLLLEVLSKFQLKKNKAVKYAVGIGEYLGKLWKWVLEKFLIYNSEEHVDSFTKDYRPIGMLFMSFYKFVTKYGQGDSKNVNLEYIEKLPISIFMLAWSSMPKAQFEVISHSNRLQIQVYMLEFCAEFYKQYTRKSSDDRKILLKDSGLSSFLLRKEVFVIPFGNNFLEMSNLGRNYWKTLWGYLSSNKLNKTQMIEVFISSVISNYNNYEYTMRCFEWLGELEMDNSPFLKDAISENLIPKFISAFIDTLNKVGIERCDLLLRLLNQLLCLASVKENEKSNLLQLLDSSVLLPSIIPVVEKILALPSALNHSYFKEILKKTKDSEVLISLLTVLYHVFETSSFTQKSFLNLGILFVVKAKLNPAAGHDGQFLVSLWKILINCARSLFLSPDVTKKNIDDFDFNAVAEYLSHKNLREFVNEISFCILEDVEFMLYKTTELKESNKILLPQVIPLIFQVLTYSLNRERFREAQLRLERLLYKESELLYLASFNALDIILKYFSVSVDLNYSDFFEKVIAKIIPIHIPPQGLFQLLNIIKQTSNPNKKKILLQAIQQAVSNSDCQGELLTPTKFFYFEPGTCLEFKNDSFEGNCQGKITVALWVKAKTKNNSIFFQTFYGKNNWLSLEFFDQKLRVKLSGIPYDSVSIIEENSWAFICVSLRAKKKGLWNKSSLNICVNEKIVEHPLNSDKLDCKIFNQLVLGTMQREKVGKDLEKKNVNEFEGKISPFFILFKSCSDVEINEIRKIFIAHNLNLSVSTLKSEDFKVLKDIKKALVFEWRPACREPFWVCKATNIIETCKRFNGVSLFEAIKLNGGLKFFLPLINLEHQTEDEVISVTYIILKIFLCTQSPEYLTQEFIQLAGHVIISVNLFSELTTNIIKIVTSLRDPLLSTKLLKLLLLNETINQIPSAEKLKHLQTLMPFIKTAIECDREHLYVIYRHIKRLDSAEVFKILDNFIPMKLNEINKDGICFLLFLMSKDKFDSSLEALLKVLMNRIDGLTIENHLEAGLIYILEQPELSFQSQIMRIILKDIKKLSENKITDNSPELERYIKLIKFISFRIPSKNIDYLTIQSIFEVICSAEVPSKIIVNLLDIITNQISYQGQDEENFLFLLNLIQQHIIQLQKYLHQSIFFPDWVFLTLKNARSKMELFSLINSIFVPQEEILKLSQLNKFVRYVSGVRDEELSEFLIRLIKKLLEDYMKAGIILKPESYFEFLKIISELDITMEGENNYIQIIREVTLYGQVRSLLSFNTTLDSSFSKLRLNPKDTKENNSFKLILSIIYKGLNYTSNENFLLILNELLEKFSYFSSQKNDKKLVYEDIVLIEIFTNLCEINLKVNEKLWLEQFIPNTSIISKIYMLVDSQSENEIKKLTDEPESQRVSMRSNTIDSERINLSISSEPSITSKRKNSQDDISAKERIKNALNPTKAYPDYLRDPEWMYVQNYLVQFFGIRKIQQRSFDSSISTSELRTDFLKEYAMKTKEFLIKYDNDWIKNSNESRNLIKMHIAKKYKAYLRSLKRLKAVLNSNHGKKFKVRPYFDGKNRQCLTKPCNPKEFSTKKVLISSSPERIYNRSYSTAYYESFLEKSGEACSPLLEENETEFSEGEEFQLVEEPDSINQPDLSQIIECERITIKGTYFGILQIHGSHLVYISEGKTKPERKYPFSALEFTQLKKECKRIWENTEISEIICRRFLHQHTALEVFLRTGKSYLFNVFDRKIRDSVFSSLSRWKNVKVIPVITSKIVKRVTKMWLENKIDNFEYLLELNKIASRSFHDLSQYPIFPWVLKDYRSEKLDLSDIKKTYRDFLFPIGAQDEVRRDELKVNFSQFIDCGIPPFHHGSHYSNGGIVLHYLVRIEPFAYQARLLQNNAFDVSDRLFISLDNAWESCISNGGDVKELVPELFFFTDVLFNINQYDYGKTQKGQSVSDFEYPPWAKSNWDFIRKHRKFLESPYVTENINNWIDLIFGYKQTGQDAIKNCNVFHAYTYEQDFAIACSTGVDENNRKGIIEQAYHFGQTPTRLFLKQHPVKRLEKSTKINIFEKFFKMEEEKKTKNECKINELSTKIESGRIFSLISTGSYLIAVKWDIKQGKYFIVRLKWEAYTEFGKKSETFELEGFNIISLDNWTEYQSWKSTLPKIDLKMILDIGQSQFAVWEDKYLVSAFHVDDTFKINSTKGELKKSIKYHCGLVTCVFTTHKTLFTGGIDSSIISWTGPDLNISLANIYLGHSSSIRQIQASENFQILISLASSGTILLHDIRNAECLRKLAEPDSRPARIMALSEMGIIAVAFMDKEFIGIFSINGAYWDDSRPGAEDVWCMLFNKTGEYLLTGSNKSIAFFDVFNKGQGLENLMYHSVDNTILAVAVSKDEEFIIYAINRDNRSDLCCLKIEDRIEKQNALYTISQFT